MRTWELGPHGGARNLPNTPGTALATGNLCRFVFGKSNQTRAQARRERDSTAVSRQLKWHARFRLGEGCFRLGETHFRLGEGRFRLGETRKADVPIEL